MKTLVKVDKNGSKHYIEDTCPRCGGTGRYYGFGVCFMCNGSGKYPHKIIERTPEYEEKLAQKREERHQKKLRDNAPENNERLFKYNNLGENGDIWIVMGNTYPIKDELKSDGARFKPVTGWYFNRPYDKYPTEKIDGDSFLGMRDWGEYYIDEEKLASIVNKLKSAYNDANKPISNSEWVGEVGDKFSGKLKFESVRYFDSDYGTRGFYKFTDFDGNIFIWKTGYNEKLEDKEGEEFLISGTIKEHSEFRGEKQNILTRCKIYKL